MRKSVWNVVFVFAVVLAPELSFARERAVGRTPTLPAAPLVQVAPGIELVLSGESAGEVYGKLRAAMPLQDILWSAVLDCDMDGLAESHPSPANVVTGALRVVRQPDSGHYRAFGVIRFLPPQLIAFFESEKGFHYIYEAAAAHDESGRIDLDWDVETPCEITH